jgi:hypothetical protein
VHYPDVTGMPRVGEAPILAALIDRIGLARLRGFAPLKREFWLLGFR